MPLTATTLTTYKSDVLVETGSYTGDGIAHALAAGFTEVHSIEVVPQYYEACCKRFAGDQRVKLYLGTSEQHLPGILQQIDRPTTFWLDAHPISDETAIGPVVHEIQTILMHGRAIRYILVDDLRIFDRGGWRTTTQDILELFTDMPGRQATTERIDTHIAPGDILAVTFK